jgi:antitoxin YefM
MKELTLNQFQTNTLEHLDAVSSDHAPLVVKTAGGHDVVMISFGDYERLLSDHLLRSPRNAEALRESIAELEAGGGRTIDRS